MIRARKMNQRRPKAVGSPKQADCGAPAQSSAFIEKALEIGADEEDRSAADDLMKRLAASKPDPHKKA
jgi:hypothetical protein